MSIDPLGRAGLTTSAAPGVQRERAASLQDRVTLSPSSSLTDGLQAELTIALIRTLSGRHVSIVNAFNVSASLDEEGNPRIEASLTSVLVEEKSGEHFTSNVITDNGDTLRVYGHPVMQVTTSAVQARSRHAEPAPRASRC